jgi:polyvinyl alcohol dehydrogenase (cytochrome)
VSWPGYHFDQGRTGAVAGQPSLDRLSLAWSADLGAAVRGQPVVADGRVVAATERNRVVALDPADGHVQWSVSLGRPLTDVSVVAGCGNVDPLGITSTPVIDTRTHTVYVVGEVSDGGSVVHHQLEGLSIATGAVRLSEGVDPPLPADERAVHLLQRASLALGNGRVYVSYGGNAGDCGSYHGWVVGMNETGTPDRVSFEVATDGEGGAIWQSGGAPALDAAGSLYVTTGNANPDPPQGGPDPKRYTESVVKLSPRLKPLASYKDIVAGGDEDLSTANPVLLPDGRLFAVGKTDIGFVLNRSTLHEVGRVSNICGGDPDGGPAYDRATGRLFVACRGGGIQVVDLGRMALGEKLPGADSAPVVVGGTVWALDHQRGVLTGYTTATGATVQSVPVGQVVPIFTSPSVGPGLVLVATNRGVVAFR